VHLSAVLIQVLHLFEQIEQVVGEAVGTYALVAQLQVGAIDLLAPQVTQFDAETEHS
jgi:hypothetical protein